jgi:putative ABC transport system permease protein
MEYFRQQITKSTAVSEVTFSSSIPGKEITTTRGLKRLNGEPKGDSNFFLVGVDEQFLDFYQIPLVAGRRFAKVHQATDQGQSVILNEQALEVLQLKDPAQAIGEQVQLNGKGRKLTIVGVIKNFHNKSLDQPQEPLVLYLDSLHEGYLSLRLQPKLLQVSLHQVEQVYSQAFPNQPLEYFFLDDFFNQQYHQEARNLTVFTSFATLSILIACLGLVGLTAHTLTAKTKEIGLRKVLGGTTAQVAGLLVKEVLKTVLLASLVALPLGFVVSTNWLSHYAFRLPLDWLYFLLPPLGVTIIALLSTGYQTFQAARTPPTRFLKQQ